MAGRQVYGTPRDPRRGSRGGPSTQKYTEKANPEPKPAEADPSPPADIVERFHKNSDVSKSAEAQHHRLGLGPYDAASGSHQHRGGDSVPLFEGMTLTGSKGGNVALTNLISILVQYGLKDNTS